ncbi:hypothetical protein QQS21_001905 [Conoideocrella luteorostrata]|uniref:Carrier domain-containing protein n=1 Tax=Conoideocrella luteorostrata TaxID=1105319 RepID=A0AAJ0CW89_9HYPO|nr:hypothetical protein QQS21_001905 [Conoideocrella luteorostrata]
MAVSKDYGRRLIVTTVDELAREEPERVVYSLAKSAQISEGFEDITARRFANAVDRTAWWIESRLGKTSAFPTVGYIGPHNDFRYILLILGCVKAGYKALLPSPRNSIEATAAVLNKSECDIWVAPKQWPSVLPQLLSARSMKVIEIPETAELLSAEPVPAYLYTKTFEDAANDPFCVLHTSGSTGLPKPIFWKNSMLSTLDAYRLLPKSESAGRPPWTVMFEEHDRFYSAFPLHHSAGLIMNILVRTYYGTSNVIGPVGVLPTINLIDLLLSHTNIRIWSIIPSIVDEIGETPAIAAKFSTSKIIIASGGPVTFASANKATKFVRIFNLTGTTEGLFQGILLVEPEDWIYFSFHPWAGFEFRELDNGVYEHWAVRDENLLALHQGIFHTFPDVKELTYKDLYEPHPNKPDLWVYRGRTDDLLVMSNGEKVRPLAMEAIINSHPAVSACLMVGTGYTMTSLLVELAGVEPSSKAERDALLDSIMEKVHAANAIGPQEARIFREYIWFAKAIKPFARTDKKTVKRRDTVLLYEDEIQGFYQRMEEEGNLSADVDFSSPTAIAQDIRKMLVAVDLPTAKTISASDNFLYAGVDSLAASSIANSLRSSLRRHHVGTAGTKLALSAKFVYAHPTINALAAALYKLVGNPANYVNDLSPSEIQRQTVDTFFHRYAAGSSDAAPGRGREQQAASAAADGKVVILTGSTGSLGSYLLDSLARQDKDVKKIFCLNRAEDSRERQIAGNTSRGLNVDWQSDHRVEFLRTDLSQPRFGLEEKTYSELLQQTTHIIHNQWPVNYNWDITSFEPHVRGVRNLADFSRESKHNSALLFVSSMATISHIQRDGPVPETKNDSLTPAVDGYGASKFVSELILDDLVAKLGVNASICRVGQISGPVLRGGEKGQWQKHNWIPTLIASSKYLGVLPSSLGPMDRLDWIPVDLLADILVELVGAAGSSSSSEKVAEANHADSVGVVATPKINGNSTAAVADADTHSPVYYHAVNPNAVEWASLVPAVVKHLGGPIKVVSWAEWMGALRVSARGVATTTSLTHNPALKLMDFFESLDKDVVEGKKWPEFGTEMTQKRCQALAALKPVSKEWMECWLEQWKF